MAGYAQHVGELTLPNSSNLSDKRKGSSTKVNVFSATSEQCLCCLSSSHQFGNCGKFRNYSVEKRGEFLKDKRVCFQCLNRDHIAPACQLKKECSNDGCTAFHHTLMHGVPRILPNRSSSRTKESTTQSFNPVTTVAATSCSTSFVMSRRKTLLLIIPGKINANGSTIETWALLDTGSDVTLVKSWIVNLLEISGIPTSISVGTVVGLSSQCPSQLVNL